MLTKANKPPAKRSEPKKAPRLAAALLAAAAAVGGVTIYLAVRPPWASSKSVVGTPGPSQAQTTRRAIEALLTRADAVGPDAAPGALAGKRQAYETACRLAQRFIQLEDRTDVVVRPVLATAQVRLGRTADAEKTVDHLLRLSPGSPEGLWMKGDLLRIRGEKGYLVYYRKAAESDQAGAEVWSRYGLELLTAGDHELARQYLTRAERAGLRDDQTRLGLAMLAIRANQFDRAITLLGDLARSPKASVRLLAMLAEAQKNAGRAAEAEQTLRKALAGRDSAVLRIELGDVLVLRHEWQEAAAMFAQAAEHPDHEAVGAFKAARCYYLAGKYALAMKHIDRAAEHLGESPELGEWVRKIENARFGEPGATSGPAVRLPPAGSLLTPPPRREGDANTSPRPRGLLE